MGEQRECAVDGVAEEVKKELARCYTLLLAVVEEGTIDRHTQTAAPVLSIDLLYTAMIN